MKQIFILLCIVCSIQCFAQQTKDTTMPKPLQELVVSGSRNAEERKKILQQIQTINKAEIEKTNAATMAEVLQNTGATFIQKSQLGGGSPIIRGFEANRVGIIIDGVRMNNAIYRGGHLQNVITIDANMLQKVEVLYGPSSALYGSDAIGGVVVMQTKNPTLSTTNSIQTNTQIMLRTQTAFAEKNLHANMSIAKKKIGVICSYTSSNFGDLKTGKTYQTRFGNWGKNILYAARINNTDTILQNLKPHIQKKSGYSQQDGFVKLLYKPSNNSTHTLNFQVSKSSNINRYDRLTEMNGNKLKFAEWYYGPQGRTLIAYNYIKTNALKFFNSYAANINFQQITESRITRNFAVVNLDKRNEKIQILGWDFYANKIITPTHKITVGIDGQQNTVTSEASSKNINTAVVSKLDTRYPGGGSNMLYNNVYMQYIGNNTAKHWYYNAGARLSNVSTNANFGDTAILHLPFLTTKQNFTAFTANAGVQYLTNNNWKISMLYSTAFRAPNIDDLAKVFESVGNQVVIPNTNLKAEKVKNIELGFSKKIKELLTVEATIYNCNLKNAMVLDSYKLNGADSIFFNGTKAAVKAMQNKAKANLQGYSINATAKIYKGLTCSLSANKTIGVYNNGTLQSPMDHIPPFYGRIALVYKVKKYEASIFSLWNDVKTITNYNPYGEDNQQFATVIGMPSWYTVNIRGGYTLHKYCTIQLGIENMLDVHYRTFASGISAPGRNITAAIRATF